jgi:uncharacterized protein (TIGR04255 family)
MPSRSQARRNKPSPRGAARRSPAEASAPAVPLVEAVAELRWALAAAATGVPRDPGTEIVLGRIGERLRGELPQLVDLPAPQGAVPFRPRHQLRPASGLWPVLQVGPGVLTVNQGSGYAWPRFEPLVRRALDALFASYPVELHPLRPTVAALRYVNAFPLGEEPRSLVAFIREQLHTTLAVDPTLFEASGDAEKPEALSFSASFPLRRASGLATLSLGSGRVQGRPAVVMQLEAALTGGSLPGEAPALADWLSKAHDVLARWFRTLSRSGSPKPSSG